MKKLHKKLRKVAEHIDLTHLNQVKHLKNLAMACDDFELAVQMRGFERAAENGLAESSKFTTTPEPGSNLDKVLNKSGWSFTTNPLEELLKNSENVESPMLSEQDKEDIRKFIHSRGEEGKPLMEILGKNAFPETTINRGLEIANIIIEEGEKLKAKKELPLAPLPEYIVVSGNGDEFIVKTFGATPVKKGDNIVIEGKVDVVSDTIGKYNTAVFGAVIGSNFRKYGVAPQEYVEHFKACEEAGVYVDFEYTYKELAEDITGKTIDCPFETDINWKAEREDLIMSELPEDEEEEPTLLVNAIKTPDGTILTSRGRHDFVSHDDAVTGTRYSLDGGTYYRRILPGGVYQDLSVYSDAPFEKIREVLERGNRGKDFDQPLKWVKLKDMSDAWLGELIPWLEDHQPNNKYKEYYQKEIEYRKLNGIKIEE